MSANTALLVNALDFDSFRNNLIRFLSAQSQFRDYNFEGSNLSQLIDLLSYNSFNDSFYKNQVINESFLDTAVLQDSAVSRAKELNYIPRSARSAQASINISIFPNDTPAYITIPRGTPFASSLDSTVYTFTTNDDVTAYSNGSSYSLTNVPIFEGSFVQEAFLMNTSNTDQQFILSNPGMDTTSLQVKVIDPSALTTPITYTYAESLLNLTANDPVFFLEATFNGQYKIIFGNGIIGKTPNNGSMIAVSYRKCNGAAPNGCSSFSCLSNLGGYSTFSITTSLDTNSNPIAAYGGADPENIDSIKFNAPRHYQTQYRAITTQDYAALLRENFPEIIAIAVYGGEDLNPPQFGRTIISIDTGSSDGVIPFILSQRISSFLKSRNVPLINPVIISPDRTYITANIQVNFDLSKTTKSASSIYASILSTIKSYASATFENFNLTFRESKFLPIIDNVDASITDQNTLTGLSKRFVPVKNVTAYSMNFQNAIIPESLSSSTFIYTNLTCALKDDGLGNINVITSNSVVAQNIGTINYTTGEVTLKTFIIDVYYGAVVKVYASSVTQDFSVNNNTILSLDMSDVILSVKPI